MAAPTRVPADHPPCRVSVLVVLAQHPTLALVRPLTKRFLLPARSVTDGVPGQLLGIPYVVQDTLTDLSSSHIL